MAEKIGYYHGLTAMFAFLRKLPGVPKRGPQYDPDNPATWPWPDRAERTLTILKDHYDAGIPDTPGPTGPAQTGATGPGPGPTFKKVAPRTYNKVLPGGSDARYCLTGLSRNAQGFLHDDVATYDDNGLCKSGRSPDTQVAGLRQANNMNGLPPCQFYNGMTAWPGDPTKNTGSWQV